MATLAQIRAKIFNKLSESSADSHFEPSQIDEYINEAVEYTAVFIEFPRAFTTIIPVDGTATYALPDSAKNITVKTAYYGDINVSGDVRPLRVITEETLKELYPNWLDATAQSKGHPRWLIKKDNANILIHPRPNADEVTGTKRIHLNMGNVPATLSADGDIPELPVPYHNIIQFYVLHLCYITLKNVEMSREMLNVFADKMKSIKPQVTNEVKEAKRFAWGESDDLSDGNELERIVLE